MSSGEHKHSPPFNNHQYDLKQTIYTFWASVSHLLHGCIKQSWIKLSEKQNLRKILISDHFVIFLPTPWKKHHSPRIGMDFG